MKRIKLCLAVRLLLLLPGAQTFGALIGVATPVANPPAVLLTVCIAAFFVADSHAEIVGSFRRVETNKTTDPSIYSGSFDTWVFELQSDDHEYNAFDLRFGSLDGAFLNLAPEITFRSTPSNPQLSGAEVPETFFTIPHPYTSIPSVTVDTQFALNTAFGVHRLNLVHSDSVPVPVAFFSVPSGKQLSATNLLRGQASGPPDFPDHTISYGRLVPEPATSTMVGLAILTVAGFRVRNRQQ